MTSHNQSTSSVCIQRSTYQTIDFDSLLSPLGGITRFVNKGERVLLKVNLLNASTPEKRVVTDPVLVKKTAELVLQAGGVPYIGDSPSGQFTKRRLMKAYEKAGLVQLSTQLGIEL